MKIGNFRFGNDYKFDVRKVVLGKDEDPVKLNKIELRYNTRKNLPSYPAMKSLYRWRSVFGFRLGGFLRQGVVKLAEIKRPFINAFNLISTASSTSLADYEKLYSTRDVMNAVRKVNPDAPSVKMLRYVCFDKIPQEAHEMAASRDHSLGKTFIDSIIKREQNKEVKEVLLQNNNDIDNMNRLITEYNKIAESHNSEIDENGGPVEKKIPLKPLIDENKKVNVEEKMKEFRDLKSDKQIRAEDREARNAFKTSRRKSRMKDFSKDVSKLGLKTAYKNLVSQAKTDRALYHALFDGRLNGPEDKKPENRGILGEIIRE